MQMKLRHIVACCLCYHLHCFKPSWIFNWLHVRTASDRVASRVRVMNI